MTIGIYIQVGPGKSFTAARRSQSEFPGAFKMVDFQSIFGRRRWVLRAALWPFERLTDGLQNFFQSDTSTSRPEQVIVAFTNKIMVIHYVYTLVHYVN